MSTILTSWPSVISVAVLLGIGLAMDAFGISITHGFKDKTINIKRALLIAGVFGVFQGIMPLIGWGIVYGFASIEKFSYIFSQIVPPLAFVILAYIGGDMIKNNIIGEKEENSEKGAKTFFAMLILEGIATSIDALSSGLAMNDYSVINALASVLIISLMTFVLCLFAIYLGKNFGEKAGNKAEMIGGIILILVGTFILIKGEIRINAPEIIPTWLEWLF